MNPSVPRREGRGNGSIDIRIEIDPRYPLAYFVPGTPILVPEELPAQVAGSHVVDEKFWYWDEEGAARYISMCADRRYPVLSRTSELLEGGIRKAFIEKAFHLFQKDRKSTGVPPIDLIIMGVGSAKKEAKILTDILWKYDYVNNPNFGPLGYVPVDVSFPLLQNNLRTLISQEELKVALRNKKSFHIRPVLADFLSPANRELFRHQPNRLIVALGIVWNAPVSTLLHELAEVMDQNSLLFLDVEFVGTRSDQQIEASYRVPSVKAFFYHPLELLYRAARSQRRRTPDFRQELDYFGDYGPRDGSVRVKVVKTSTLRAVFEANGIPERARAFIKLPSDPRSRTILIYYKSRESRRSVRRPASVVLGYSTRFHYSEFRQLITDSGLRVVGEWLDKKGDSRASTYGFYLLSKSGAPPPKSARLPPATAQVVSLIDGFRKEDLKLHRYRVIGDYMRYEDRERHDLQELNRKILDDLSTERRGPEAYLIWAPSGLGKTHFVRQVAKEAKAALGQVTYVEHNLSDLRIRESKVEASLRKVAASRAPALFFVDEIDTERTAAWAYGLLYSNLVSRDFKRVVFVFAGSCEGNNVGDLTARINSLGAKHKGPDFSRRIPKMNRVTMRRPTGRDRAVIAAQMLCAEGRYHHKNVREIDAVLLYYAALDKENEALSDLRKVLGEAVKSAPRLATCITLSDLFAGAPKKKDAFIARVRREAPHLTAGRVYVED